MFFHGILAKLLSEFRNENYRVFGTYICYIGERFLCAQILTCEKNKKYIYSYERETPEVELKIKI